MYAWRGTSCITYEYNDTFVLTGSVMTMLRIVNQRMDSHAQLMAQEFAKQVYDIAMQYFPAATEALKK